MSLLTRIFGDANAKTINGYKPLVERINALEGGLSTLDSADLPKRTHELRERLLKGAELDELVPEAFALVREAAQRSLQQRHFDVQLMGGLTLHQGGIAEMKTGEGKTLVATLAAYANALGGYGVHVVTVNDYLAKRDTVWMGRVYHALGLTVGCIQHDQAFLYFPDDKADPDDIMLHLKLVSRKEAYAADITYGTNNEYGFDFLRDNMAPDLTEKVQRGHAYAIIDEVDSILIDEARTPLIISAPAEQPAEQYYQFAKLVARLSESEHYNVDEKMRAATLTEKGIDFIEKDLGVGNIYEERGIETVHHVEQALKARALYQKDRDYVVKDGEIIIVDEFTGRMLQGRRFSEGLHQAIEAKEGVQIKEESVTLATITFQNYFRMYEKLSGMTGTAASEAEEFAKIYTLDVVSIPTNMPLVRKDLGDKVYPSERGKLHAVVTQVKELQEKGQPVLIGTVSIEKNELLSQLLTDAGITHEVLNAKNHDREAEIIAQAGRKGAVTLATNIAGRGVDIILGGKPFVQANADEVKGLGGLFVLGSERHEARRIDNQLRGRSGRQGDPGMSQFFVSMDDDLMRVFGSERMKAMTARLGLPDDTPIENKLVSRAIESAQKKVEGHNFDIRKHLLEYDDVINKHREVMYRRRNQILDQHVKDGRVRSVVLEYIENAVERVVSFHTAAEHESAWDIKEIYEVVSTYFPIDLKQRLQLEELRDIAGDAIHDVKARESMMQHLMKLANDTYDVFEQRVGDTAIIGAIERAVLLRSIDSLWIEHLDLMDHLRRGIGLRGYGQRDPLIEYKKEAYELFQELTANIQNQVASTIFKVTGARQPVQQRSLNVVHEEAGAFHAQPETASDVPATQLAQAKGEPVTAAHPKIGRNEPCWCGAKKADGTPKKYKHCHGKNA